MVFAGQALADEHHEAATTSDATLRATSDSDALTAADIFSGVATNGVASSEKASETSTTSQTVSETATSEATSEVSASQTADKASETAVAPSAVTNRSNLAEKDANLDVSSMVRAAVNTSLVSTPTTTTDSDLPSQGTYVYKERTEIKNQPKISAKAEFYVNPGDSVFYDQVVTADGYQWISYKSYSGVRRYAPVKPVAAGSGSGNSGSGDGKPSNGAQATTGALNIPATGTFYFTHDTDIKKEPKADLKPTFVFSKGDHVIYDKVLTADNHQWISYLGYDYVRYYADIATLTPAKAETPAAKPTETNQAKPETTGAEKLPASGTYNVTRSLNVKNEPKASAETLYTLEKGYKVNYDKVLTADNHQWISYIGYDYERYYADIAALKAENTGSTTEATRDEAIPERGTYYFTKVADVKNQPSLTAKTEFNFDPGMSVNYDRSLLADNHRWISYTSYSGTRRYVDLGAVAEAVAKPRGDIAIESHDNGDFSVLISNVSDQNGILGVSVPIWSEKNGQDDIIWYNATRLNNGNYKVNVSLTDHKNERGLYNVHLYYVETNGKLVGVGGTTYTVPAKVEETHTTTTSYSLPDSGTYTFKERSSIKAEPLVASPELAYYDAGMSVNYDKIVSGDGYQWLSYLSFNGNRRYVAVAKLAQQESKPSGTINIENLSNLGFDVHITNVSGGDKAIQGVSVPVWTAKDGQDDLVWHQADRQSDGSYKVRININDHKAEAGEYIVHLYYVQDGKMVGIGGTSTTVPVQNATRHNLPASGSYTFTARTGIKTQPLVANPDVSYYDAGMSVNYDKVVNNDGYTWLSYLSYSGNRFYVAIAPTSVTKPVEQPVQPSTPSSGTYTFKERSSIKAEPSVASPELAYYDAGMSVNYDKVVTADGHTWLSYLSRGGNRRYIAIDGKATAVAQPASSSLAATGTYTFTKPSSIKAQPSVASPELAYYDKGMSVRYDKVLTADGHTWLSYMTYSGARRYVDIS